MTVLGAVLTGGMSSRMGQDKADVLVDDRTMLEMVGSAVRAATDRAILLGPDRDGWECWPDSVHSKGPLAGIATALERMSEDHLLVVAVDHPFVRLETLSEISRLASNVPVVPVDEHGVRQVTCAVYPKDIGDAAVEEATSGGSIQSLLDRVSFRPIPPEEWRAWGEDGRSWYSTDDPEAIREGLASFQI